MADVSDEGNFSTTVERHRPTQQRSRNRVERIIAAASGIIAARGAEQLKMSEIATSSEMSLAALYRYFPDKAAIVRTLAERYNAESRACIAEALDGVYSQEDFEAAFTALLEQYLSIVRSEPVMRDIWSGMHADKQLSELQAEETRICADILASALIRIHPSGDPAAQQRLSLLLWELGEAAVRLAMTLPTDDGDAIVAIYTRMALHEMLPSGGRSPR